MTSTVSRTILIAAVKPLEWDRRPNSDGLGGYYFVGKCGVFAYRVSAFWAGSENRARIDLPASQGGPWWKIRRPYLGDPEVGNWPDPVPAQLAEFRGETPDAAMAMAETLHKNRLVAYFNLGAAA